MTEDNPPVEIAVLGPLRVRVGGVDQPISAPKQRRLLARLAVDADQVVSSDLLIDTLWGETPPASARKNLQVLVGRLRSVLGARVLVADPGGYRLDSRACEIDAVAFERRLFEVTDSASDASVVSASIGALEEALSLWRGHVAEELDAPWGSPRADRWIELRNVAQERLLVLRMMAGPAPGIIEDIRESIARQPHRESLRVLLVQALRYSGDLIAARDALDDAFHVLQHDLGLAPGRDLTNLAAEFGAAGIAASRRTTRPPSRIAELIDTFDSRFFVADVLGAIAGDVPLSDALDELEALVECGTLARSIGPDGRAQLTRIEQVPDREVTR